jgi:drug/metabolite transporter (DMT)-like permease
MSWLFVMTLVSGCVIAVLALLARQDLGAPRGDEWLALAGIGVIPGSIGHFLITWAHPRIHAAASSAVILGVPVLASIGAAILVDEPFGPLQAAGGLVALAAAGAALRHLPPPATVEAAETYGEIAT